VWLEELFSAVVQEFSRTAHSNVRLCWVERPIESAVELLQTLKRDTSAKALQFLEPAMVQLRAVRVSIGMEGARGCRQSKESVDAIGRVRQVLLGTSEHASLFSNLLLSRDDRVRKYGMILLDSVDAIDRVLSSTASDPVSWSDTGRMKAEAAAQAATVLRTTARSYAAEDCEILHDCA